MTTVKPSGTVTFIFTDIEASTRLWEEQPVAVADAVCRHDTIVRDVVGAAMNAEQLFSLTLDHLPEPAVEAGEPRLGSTPTTKWGTS